MSNSNLSSQKIEAKPSLFSDIRIIFSTILTDPGSSLAYGADAVIAVTSVLIYQNYQMGLIVTLGVGFTIMLIYICAVLSYNLMSKYHTHKKYGGGAFVSSVLTANKFKNPIIKKFLDYIGKTGAASLLADFPVTQAISLISGVEALYFVPPQERLYWFIGFLTLISLVQKFGLNKLSYYLIWPVLSFYTCNLIIQFTGIIQILQQGWHPPVLKIQANQVQYIIPTVLIALANGTTLITGVEVGYSSINIPYHKHRAMNFSMIALYFIVFFTYIFQLINFLGVGIDQNSFKNIPPVPIQIAYALGGDYLATFFGLLTAVILILAAQTSQTDYPLGLLRASRENYFPKGIGDSAWRKTRPPLGIGQHGVYNPSAVTLLFLLSLFIIYLFPDSHKIEGMYGLAVITAMTISIFSYLLRLLRAKIYNIIIMLTFSILLVMLVNILYQKFFEGAWFTLLLMCIYFLIFMFSSHIYKIWEEKQDSTPLESLLWDPVFCNLPVDKKNLVLVSKFHPGVLLFLKDFVKSGRMPFVVHFQSESEEKFPASLPEWYKVLPLEPEKDTVTSIVDYVKALSPSRVHIIPLLVSGGDFIRRYFFGNSIDRLRYALSQVASLQVEYNRVRVDITIKEVLKRMLPRITLNNPFKLKKIKI